MQFTLQYPLSISIVACYDSYPVFWKAHSDIVYSVCACWWQFFFTAKDSGTELEDSGSNFVERSHFDDLVTEYIDVYEDMKHTKDDLLKLQDLVSYSSVRERGKNR